MQRPYYIMVDIESDGPIPGDFSMISFGAVLVDEKFNTTFYGQLKPISENYIPSALNISGHSREDVMTFGDPKQVMSEFKNWLDKNCDGGKPIFISDNNGFDWMFVCWYFIHFLGHNPFGHSSQNLGSFYKGVVNDTTKSFKDIYSISYTHNPLMDALHHAQCFLRILKENKTKLF